MCFSTSVSFSASIALIAIGTAIIRKIQNKSFMPLAMIPFFFAVQQFAEGVVWLDVTSTLRAKNVFLFFAYVFWPIYIPFCFYVSENQQVKKQFICILWGVGLCLATALAFVIPSAMPVANSGSIQYIVNPAFDLFSHAPTILYVIATLGPIFLSSIPKMKIVGLLMTLAAVVTHYVNEICFVSLWCFWAALLSALLYFVLKNPKEKGSL